jgi:hypothetical protein
MWYIIETVVLSLFIILILHYGWSYINNTLYKRHHHNHHHINNESAEKYREIINALIDNSPHSQTPEPQTSLCIYNQNDGISDMITDSMLYENDERLIEENELEELIRSM